MWLLAQLSSKPGSLVQILYLSPTSNQSINQIKSDQFAISTFKKKTKLQTFLTKRTPPWSTEPRKPQVSTRSLRARLFMAPRLNVWPAVFQRGECIVTMPGSNCNQPWKCLASFCWVWGRSKPVASMYPYTYTSNHLLRGYSNP